MSHQPPLTEDEIAEIEQYIAHLSRNLPPDVREIEFDPKTQVVKYIQKDGNARTVSARALLAIALPRQESS